MLYGKFLKERVLGSQVVGSVDLPVSDVDVYLNHSRKLLQ